MPPTPTFYALCPAHQEQVCLHGIRLLHKSGHRGATDTKTRAGPKPSLAQTGSAVPLVPVSLSVTVSAMILTNFTPPDVGFSTSPMSSDDVQWNVSCPQPSCAEQSMVCIHPTPRSRMAIHVTWVNKFNIPFQDRAQPGNFHHCKCPLTLND